MIINEQSLNFLYTGIKAKFQTGFQGVKPAWPELATKISSSAREEHYTWLGQFPRLREWIGDRVIQNLKAYGYTIKNRKFESTIQISRDSIEDDSYGLFAPLFADMGAVAATHPDELLFELMVRGFQEKCYDGQYFFDSDHPVGEGVVSNCHRAETGQEKAPWFLLDTSRALKPFIYQDRRPYELTAMTSQADENVFMRDEYLYGVDARANMGFGFWQQAFGSNQDLTAENFNHAYAAMTGLKSDEGRPLGIKPTILLCGMSNREKAFYIAKADRMANNIPNPNYQVVDVIVTPHLP